MNLYSKYFDKIKAGKKKIELRLYDEKRKAVRLGDTILIHRLPKKEEAVSVKVIGISLFKSFNEVYSAFPPSFFDHPTDITVKEQIEKERQYYTEEREQKNGVVAFHIRLIK